MRKISICSFLMLTLFGCNQAQIKVVDESNNPLAGARVFSLSPSTQGEPGITNSNGIAPIHQIIGGNMLRIELAGFETAFINTDPKAPALVALKKTSH
ncbi:MAG: Ig-like domain-containing protein [Azonexus sp.]